jgi:chromosome segregation ATPase
VVATCNCENATLKAAGHELERQVLELKRQLLEAEVKMKGMEGQLQSVSERLRRLQVRWCLCVHAQLTAGCSAGSYSSH